ncbi:hypothetical protein HED60_08900 [Planctomycetales bacterium ZRK34]|nr:hypothetical protein HED60_08900 [Planctomycetales bacterium ZRK34]
MSRRHDIMTAFVFVVWFLLAASTITLLITVDISFRTAFYTPLALLTILLIVIFSASTKLMTRRRRNRVVVNYLEQAVRLNLPLTEMLDAAAESETGGVRRTLHRLRHELEAGRPLGEALADASPDIDQRTIGLITASQNTGHLAPTLRWLTAPDHDSSEHVTAQQQYTWLYPVVLTTIIAMGLVWLSMLVFPKHQQLFDDYQIAMPAITQAMFDASTNGTAKSIMLVLLAAIWIWSTMVMFLPHRAKLRRWVGLDVIVWFTPIVGTITRNRDWRDVMRMLGSATAAGLSLESALTESMQLHVNPVTRRKLLRWRDAMESGAEIDEAAQQARLPEMVSGMLATVKHTNQLPRAIGYLSRYYEDKFTRAAALTHGAVLPVIEIVMGAIVAGVALAVISPIFTLINALTGGGP